MTPRPRLRALGLLVLVLHLVLGLALHRLLRPAPRGAMASAPTHVWISLRPEPLVQAAARRPVAATPPREPAPAMPRTARQSPQPVEPQAITVAPPATVPATVLADAPGATAAAPQPAAPTASAPAAPLNLALPGRPASAPPANAWTRSDPRVHAAPLDGDQRMARTLGTDTALRTTARGDGFELRRGNDCVQVQPSRAGQIFMPDGGSRPPSQVGKC